GTWLPYLNVNSAARDLRGNRATTGAARPALASFKSLRRVAFMDHFLMGSPEEAERTDDMERCLCIKEIVCHNIPSLLRMFRKEIEARGFRGTTRPAAVAPLRDYAVVPCRRR